MSRFEQTEIPKSVRTTNLTKTQGETEVTFSKAILLHFSPVVQESNETVSSWAPTGTDCSAIQFTFVVPLEPSPYSKTQTVNSLLSTDSTQIAAPSPPLELFVAWLLETKTFTSLPSKGFSKETFSHANRPGVVMVKLHIPVLILSAGKYQKVKKIKISVKTKYRDEYSLLYLQRLGKKVQLRRRKPTTIAHGLLARYTSCFKWRKIHSVEHYTS